MKSRELYLDAGRLHRIPSNSELFTLPECSAVVYFYTSGQKQYAIGFRGKAQKPSFHYSFKTTERRSEYCFGWLCDQAEAEASIAERKAKEAAERASFVTGFMVGDVIHYSWGYEQTNPEFYQVIEVKGKSVVIRRIKQETATGSEFSHGMAENRLPVFDAFIGEPIRKVVRPGSDGRGLLSFDFGVGSFWGNQQTPGRAVYCSWYA